MINKDRIVPVQKTDLLSLYGTIANMMLALNAFNLTGFKAVEAENPEGDFILAEENQNGVGYALNQPAKSITFTDDILSGCAFSFVADYDFEGFKLEDGTAVATDFTDMAQNPVEIVKDGVTLYYAMYIVGTGVEGVQVGC